jgi:hypothetical protein
MTRDKISENMTFGEAAEFWDGHSFLDYDDAQEIHFSVDLRKNRNYIDLDEELVKQIRMIAYQKGISARVLVNQWLKEKVAVEHRSKEWS